MTNNYLNLAAEERNKEIYRILSVDRLLEMLNKRLNSLVKPCLWDDPFENVILQSPGRLRDGKIFRFGMRNSFYGQCWTFNKESDAMWRIYAHNKDRAKMKTPRAKARGFNTVA